MVKLFKSLIGLNQKKESKNPYQHLLKEGRYNPLYVTLLGKEFKIADSRSFYYNYKEIFEDDIYLFKSKNSKPVIIDCGANYGTSIVYFKHKYPGSIINAFEADPSIYNILKQNIESFDFENVFIHNNAVWDEESYLTFNSEGSDSGRILVNENLDAKTQIKVKTTLLSPYLKETKIDFLKIDIEGAELNVLFECEPYLGNVANIFVEYHSFINKPQQLSELLQLLRNAGFRYQIKHQMVSNSPFININTYNGMDLQLNIFGYR